MTRYSELWTPICVDRDFDLQDSEGGLIALQASCGNDKMMQEIVTSVNYHQRLRNALDKLHRDSLSSFEYRSSPRCAEVDSLLVELDNLENTSGQTE